eukprot:2671434-Pleurochrysis_carterae.AAC.3
MRVPRMVRREVCGLITCFVSCRSLPVEERTPLFPGRAAARSGKRERGESLKCEGRGSGRGESSAARRLRKGRSVRCAKAACEAVESRDVGRSTHLPPALIQRLRLACRQRGHLTVSLCEATAPA